MDFSPAQRGAFLYADRVSSRGLTARSKLKRLVDAMLVARMKMCADHDIPERDGRIHGKHNASRSGSAEKCQDPGEELQEEVRAEVRARHCEAFEVRSGRIGRHVIILDTG